MAGLKLQVLSGLPSFQIGNPGMKKRARLTRREKGLARRYRKTHRAYALLSKDEKADLKKAHRRIVAKIRKVRENRRMSKRRRVRNPFVTTARKGKRKIHVGAALTRGERLATAQRIRGLRKALRNKNIGADLRSKAKASLTELTNQMRGGQRHRRRVLKKAADYKRKGYKMSSKTVSFEEAARKPRRRRHKGKKSRKGGKRKYGIISNVNGILTIRRKDGTLKKVKLKRRKKAKAVSKRRRRRKAKASSPKRRRRKARKSSKRRRRRKVSAAPKRRRRRKARKSSSRRRRRRHSAKYWAKRHHKGHMHVSLKGLKRRHKRRGTVRRGKKKYHYSVYRKNPFGGNMGKAMDFVTAGDPREAGFILAAAALSEVIASAALQIPGLGSALTSINTALTGVNPSLAAAVVPILPTFAAALAAEFIGQKTGKKAVLDFGRALMITNIVDLGEALGATVSSAAGLSGVAYTPMGRRRSMKGVDFTMGAVPRGLGSVPRGLRAIPSMGGLTRHDNGDFGGVDFTSMGRQMADFGGENLMTPAGMVSTAADFGRRRHMGAVPSLRGGAHTGDVMYPDPQVDSDGNEIDLDESNDHMT